MNVFKAGRISTNVKAAEKVLARPCEGGSSSSITAHSTMARTLRSPGDTKSVDTLWSNGSK
jgi:hypothetical protein